CITKNGKQAKLAFGSNTPVSDPFSVTHKMLRPQRGYFKNTPNFNNNPNNPNNPNNHIKPAQL
ncbi:hypothetical protein, partial [Undibacterium sp.]|uniref:hypothetical protein n=1 Tax=Undibacterium sp. TaxID=1914977 RepID=UPI00374CF50C